MVYRELAGSLALLAGVTALLPFGSPSGAASAVQARGPSSEPLRPLSERDLTSTRQMGCTCTFASRDRTFMQMIGNELMVRNRAGRQVCRITDRQFQRLSGGNGSAACGGVRMSFRRTGRSTLSPESDSSSAPAAMTVSQGRTQRRLAGTWGCAC